MVGKEEIKMKIYFTILIAIIFITFLLKLYNLNNDEKYETIDTIQLIVTTIFFVSQIIFILMDAFINIL